jgi:hypothetical protein
MGRIRLSLRMGLICTWFQRGRADDRSSIGKMFSWGSAQPTNTVRIRPSDSGNSIKERRSPPMSTKSSSSELGVGPDKVKKESYRDLLSE